MHTSNMIVVIALIAGLVLHGCGSSSEGVTAQADAAIDNRSPTSTVDAASDGRSEKDVPIPITNQADGATDSPGDLADDFPNTSPADGTDPEVSPQNDVPLPSTPDAPSPAVLDGGGLDMGIDVPITLCPSPAEDAGPAVSKVDGSAPVATILALPSTDVWGYRYDIYCDSSAVHRLLPCRGSPESSSCAWTGHLVTSYIPPGTPWIVQCLADLQAVGDVSTIRTATDASTCGSPSSGSVLTISFDGHSTSDLSCPREDLTQLQEQLLTDCLKR